MAYYQWICMNVGIIYYDSLAIMHTNSFIGFHFVSGREVFMKNTNKKYYIKTTAVSRKTALTYCQKKGMSLYKHENTKLTLYAWDFGIGNLYL